MSRITGWICFHCSCEKLRNLTAWQGSADKREPQQSNIKDIIPKKADSLKSSAAPSEVSAIRSDASTVIIFQLAKVSSIFLSKFPRLSSVCQPLLISLTMKLKAFTCIKWDKWTCLKLLKAVPHVKPLCLAFPFEYTAYVQWAFSPLADMLWWHLQLRCD